jgi:hypothetical protein
LSAQYSTARLLVQALLGSAGVGLMFFALQRKVE